MWFTDPVTKLKSVTLTFFTISFIVVMLLCVAESLAYVKGTSSSLEVLYAMAALYLGRKINFKSKNLEMSSQGATTDKESE